MKRYHLVTMLKSHNAMEILREETCLSAVLSCAYPVHAGFAAIELQVTSVGTPEMRCE